MTSDNQRRIVFLDYMRIFAFTSVLIGHKFYPAMERFVSDQNNNELARLALELCMPLFYGGVVGVIVFFLVSGYIITHVLNYERPVEFLIKRAFRIYPLYVSAVIIQAVLDHEFNNIEIPNIGVMIPRILLLGDFFNTPYSLSGVEWTLRIEILFYLYMAVLKKFGALDKPRILPWTYAATVAAIFLLPAFPTTGPLAYGYTSIYFGILLAGSCLYLAKNRLSSVPSSLLCAALMVAASLLMIETYQPTWAGMNFIYYGLLIFCLAMQLENRLTDGKHIKLLSGMTFSIYLFHNWLTDYIVDALKTIQTIVPGNALAAMPILFGLCYLAHRAIEKPATQAGRTAAVTPPPHKPQL